MGAVLDVTMRWTPVKGSEDALRKDREEILAAVQAIYGTRVTELRRYFDTAPFPGGSVPDDDFIAATADWSDVVCVIVDVRAEQRGIPPLSDLKRLAESYPVPVLIAIRGTTAVGMVSEEGAGIVPLYPFSYFVIASSSGVVMTTTFSY